MMTNMNQLLTTLEQMERLLRALDDLRQNVLSKDRLCSRSWRKLLWTTSHDWRAKSTDTLVNCKPRLDRRPQTRSLEGSACAKLWKLEFGTEFQSSSHMLSNTIHQYADFKTYSPPITPPCTHFLRKPHDF